MTDKQAQKAQLAMLAANVRAAGTRVLEAQRELVQADRDRISAIKQGAGRDVRTAAAARINALEERLALLKSEYIEHQKKALAAKRGPLALS